MIANSNFEVLCLSHELLHALIEVDLIYKTVDEIGIEIVEQTGDTVTIKRPLLNNEYMSGFIDKLRAFCKVTDTEKGLMLCI